MWRFGEYVGVVVVAVVITFGFARQTMKKKESTATEMRENNNVCYSAFTV